MSKKVNKYRLFCATESNLVYTWSPSPPTTCPNNSQHTIDSASISIIDTVESTDTFVSNANRCPYGDWRVAEKSLVIELKSCAGKSSLRDIDIVTGTGAVTNNVGDPEYRLSTTGANDKATLYSAERGRYISGIGAEVGIGIRVPALPTGNQVYRWGLFDANNGFFFQLTASGLSIVVRRDSIDEVVPSANFNGQFDASTWEPGRGYIYNISFSWYGYGSINFLIQNKPANWTTPFFRIHTFDPYDKTSLKNPNLPLAASIENNGTVTPGLIFVAGRQYSVLGKYIPLYRSNGAFRMSAPVNSIVTFLPILSVRRKAGYNGTAVKLSGLDLTASTNMIVQIRTGGTLTSSVFASISDQQASETIMEQDTASTAISGGVTVWTGIVSADRSAVQKLEDFTYVITEYSAITVCARAITQTNGTLSVCLRVSEEW